MKFKDWITWIFVRPITKKPVYYKRKDGIVTLTVKNCDIPLKEIDKFWVKKWKSISMHLPDLSFAGLRVYDSYWDGRNVIREPDKSETPTLIELGTDDFIVYLGSDKTGAGRKLTIYSAEYEYKGKDLVITIYYDYTKDRDY